MSVDEGLFPENSSPVIGRWGNSCARVKTTDVHCSTEGSDVNTERRRVGSKVQVDCRDANDCRRGGFFVFFNYVQLIGTGILLQFNKNYCQVCCLDLI